MAFGRPNNSNTTIITLSVERSETERVKPTEDEMPRFLVVVDAFGDGSVDYGRRITSIRCETREAAEQIVTFLTKGGDTNCLIIDEGVDE